jgi:lysophospholipase L1-like esterase
MQKLLMSFFLFTIFHSTISAQTAPPFWAEIKAFQYRDSINPVAPNGILFVGSSSFTKWKDVNNYFPGFSIINRGFGGSSLTDVIRYTYNIILPYQPKQVVIYCGENDLASSKEITATDVVNRVKTLFGMIRQNLPDAEIDFVSIKPSPVRMAIQPKVKEANAALKIFFKKEKKAEFIDIYDAMLDANGNMREELYVSDRLHMKPEGYKIWQKIIAPYLLKN